MIKRKGSNYVLAIIFLFLIVNLGWVVYTLFDHQIYTWRHRNIENCLINCILIVPSSISIELVCQLPLRLGFSLFYYSYFYK
jgi:hypothetical protein